ncbi:hypothetical protein [Thiocapsa roseopersicina]|uniref:hypothetical protein n=1 Tax=Thiocapsa roseopersicina TaxID=1058 RepID=UPI001FDF83D4|nr:hypothetical protein [Thiocapsa roseopersicina]
MLLHIDEDLAEAAREAGCPACGGTLHQADYPRKPRGCPEPWREAFATRRSFCCAQCRRRLTPRSVRFLGRRVYLGLIVVLACVRHRGQHPQAAALAGPDPYPAALADLVAGAVGADPAVVRRAGGLCAAGGSATGAGESARALPR